jgi:hypothetical protein
VESFRSSAFDLTFRTTFFTFDFAPTAMNDVTCCTRFLQEAVLKRFIVNGFSRNLYAGMRFCFFEFNVISSSGQYNYI